MSAAGYVDGVAVPRRVLDARLAALRGGPRAASLPAPGSTEDRQLTRWLAQVLLTEELCAAEARARGLDLAAAPGPDLDQRAAVELGSITATAYAGSPAVRAVYAALTAGVEADDAEVARLAAARSGEAGRRWTLRYGVYADETAARSADASALAPLGEVGLAELPTALAAALAAASPGDRVGPLAGPHGWQIAQVEAVSGGDAPTAAVLASREDVRRAGGRRVFTRWLDAQRAARVVLVPGLEHPGDPHQPDNHHRH